MRQTRTFTEKERQTLISYLATIGIDANGFSDDGLYSFMITNHLEFSENSEIIANGYLSNDDCYNLYMYGHK